MLLEFRQSLIYLFFLTFQHFVRDPDGYYIEFCNCKKLEKYLHAKMVDDAQKYNFSAVNSMLTYGKKLSMIANDSKQTVEQLKKISLTEEPEKSKRVRYPRYPETFENNAKLNIQVDPLKFENLKKRQNIYGDITQNASEEELEKLLIHFQNDVPKVIGALEHKTRSKGTRTFIPPAFFGRNGEFYQPPAFEMPSMYSAPGQKMEKEI